MVAGMLANALGFSVIALNPFLLLLEHTHSHSTALHAPTQPLPHALTHTHTHSHTTNLWPLLLQYTPATLPHTPSHILSRTHTPPHTLMKHASGLRDTHTSTDVRAHTHTHGGRERQRVQHGSVSYSVSTSSNMSNLSSNVSNVSTSVLHARVATAASSALGLAILGLRCDAFAPFHYL